MLFSFEENICVEKIGLLRRLGAFWGHVGASWAPLGASWLSPGGFWAGLVASWSRLGASWEPRWEGQRQASGDLEIGKRACRVRFPFEFEGISVADSNV